MKNIPSCAYGTSETGVFRVLEYVYHLSLSLWGLKRGIKLLTMMALWLMLKIMPVDECNQKKYNIFVGIVGSGQKRSGALSL